MELHYGRVTSKGQITIPAAIRKRLELETGSSVLFLVRTDGLVEVSHPAKDIEAAFGTFPLPPGTTGTELAAMGRDAENREVVAQEAAMLAR